MKRFLFLLIFLFAIPAFAYEDWQAAGTVTSGQTTGVILLPDSVGEGSYIAVPALTASAVSLEGSLDGTNYGTVYSYSNAANMVAYATASGSGGYVLLLPDIRCFRKLRVTIASQGANKAFTVYGKRRNN